MPNSERIDLHPLVKTLLLPQAYEERRYYRRLHHTIWTLWITISALLLGAQLANLSAIVALRTDALMAAIVTFGLFAAFPALGIYFIARFHITYYWHARFIAEHAEALQREAYGDARLDEAMQIALDHIIVRHYRTTAKHPLQVGRGHPIFIATIVLFAVLNAVVFWFGGSPTI